MGGFIVVLTVLHAFVTVGIFVLLHQLSESASELKHLRQEVDTGLREIDLHLEAKRKTDSNLTRAYYEVKCYRNAHADEVDRLMSKLKECGNFIYTDKH